MRKNILWYLKGFRDSNQIKNKINTLSSMEDIFLVLDKYEENY